MQTRLNKYSIAQVWSQANCPACDEAKRILTKYEIPWQECKLGTSEYTKEQLFEMVPNARSVPQIFLNGFHVGGLQELKKLLNDNDQRVKME